MPVDAIRVGALVHYDAARHARGPRLELFARKPRQGWVTWGNEAPPDPGEMPDIPAFLRRPAP